MMPMRIASTDALKQINDFNKHLNQGLSPEGVAMLDPEGTHVCFLSMVHNDDHLRTTLWLVKLMGRKEPVHAKIDMTFDDYNGLTEAPKLEGEGAVQR